jgi:chromosome segregation ATPase
MKKGFVLALAVILGLATGCQQKGNSAEQRALAQRDSLEKIIAQRDNEVNDMMGTLNEIQEGFREINEAENRVNIVKDGEGANKTQQIRENIKFISTRMKENRELIKKLQAQLAKSNLNGDQLQKTIANMQKQLDEKEQQLQEMREELDAKNIHIAELDETINNLNTNVASQKVDIAQKTQTINSQDKQLNTAWYVFGTKKELKDERILVNGKVLQGNFNKNYFTKIDIRNQKEIKLYSKSAKMLTAHPSSSYTLAQDANKQYVLTIKDPQLFWSTSKYLVIQVK